MCGAFFSGKIEGMNRPLTGTPNRVIEQIFEYVNLVSNHSNVSEFYVGRTTDLSATQRRHRCDEIIPIYETSSTDNAAIVEDALIKSFYTHYKCNNTSTHCGGNCSPNYYSYVYVALWFTNT